MHRCNFMHKAAQIASFSDDKTVKVWDIPTQQAIQTFEKHTDYIRAGAVTSALPDIVLSGGYDNEINMYDTRTNQPVLTVNHGSPVESLLFLPSGSVFLTAGGTVIKMWDAIGGGKLLGSLSQHHKTITCLRLASNGKRLMSGSLDRHVKVYDLKSYEVVHTLDYPNGVLSLGVSENDETVVAGLVDGLVCIRRMEEDQKKNVEEKKEKKKVRVPIENLVMEFVPEKETVKQSKHDYFLRKFQFSKALDVVLLPYTTNKTPEVTISVIHDLIRRKALHRVLHGRDTKFLLLLLRFFIKYLSDYRFTRVIIEAMDIFLDVYEDSIPLLTTDVKVVLANLATAIEREQKLAEELGSLKGAMELLLASSSAGSEGGNVAGAVQVISPSADAQKPFSLTVS